MLSNCISCSHSNSNSLLRNRKINRCARSLSRCTLGRAVFSLLWEIAVSTQRVTEAHVTDGFDHRVCAYFTYSFCVKSSAEQTLTMDFLYTKGLPHSKTTIRMQPQAWPLASVNSLTSFRMST